ncbi:metallophosphoesterase [Phormidium tenue FACHB-886]|nr:metallophosphoesterase [Phormidium tenue FACHB-886]
MQFVTDPPIATKIEKMKQRVRWQSSGISQRGIDQTCLVLDDQQPDDPEFSFLVVGDSGAGAHRGQNPQRRVAEQLLKHRQDCRFLLHTGDVIYLTGSSEYYTKNFIEPYREFLVGGDRYKSLKYDQLVFNLPFFLVPGNHDYYDLSWVYGSLAQLALPLRRLLRSQLDLDVGFHGSHQGDAYAKAFIDYLKALSPDALEDHLDRHYSTTTETGRCLRYQPGQFTRLPNRYYTFRAGGIDFFALDSNTFNAPLPLPNTKAGDEHRRRLQALQADIDKQMAEVNQRSTQLNPNHPEESEELHDLRSKLEQLAEVQQDIEKQLTSSPETVTIDTEQLEWLQQRLTQSWQDSAVRGRVLFFHHPPYVTEATKWHQAQTIAVRERLREVLNAVAANVGALTQGRPIVDLVLNGHAHCLEYLRTLDTGNADSHINWIVCGGSGYSLRRQREEGAELPEAFTASGQPVGRAIAKSQLYVGRSGQGYQKRRPYSCLRIDVKAGCPPQFVVRPLVTERFQRQWLDRELDAFVI